MSVAAVVVSADRAKKPGDEDTRALAKASLEEDLPPSAIRAGKGAPDLQIQIPEARRMTLVYDLDLAKLKRPVAYDVDRAAKVTQPFDRIGYLLELERGAEAQFVFVSMDAFTAEAAKIGIPDAEGTVFQKPVTGMCILSNVPGVATGQRLEGNLEFWPNNYGAGNGANVPGASASTYDFGDQPGAPASGYGSMQVHHAKGKQTVFAINKWNAGGSGADIGIGNSPAGNPDWTFTGSGKTYASKRLRIYVRLR
jgi:sialate O-acetylesterase